MHQREVLRHEGFGVDRPYPLRLIAPGAHALWVLSQILVVARCVTLNPLPNIGRLRLQRRAAQERQRDGGERHLRRRLVDDALGLLLV